MLLVAAGYDRGKYSVDDQSKSAGQAQQHSSLANSSVQSAKHAVGALLLSAVCAAPAHPSWLGQRMDSL